MKIFSGNFKYILVSVLASLLLLGASLNLSAREPASSSPASEVVIGNDLVSMDARDADIRQVLGEIAAQTGIAMTVAPEVAGRITLQMTDVPLEEALRRLCASRALIYEYLPDKKSFRIIAAGAYASGRNDGTPPAPVSGKAPPSVNPSDPPPQPAAPSVNRTDSAANPATPADSERRYDSQGRLLYKPRELLVKFRDGVTRQQIDDLNRNLGSTVLKVMAKQNIYRLRIREGLSEKEALSRYGVSELVDVVQRHALRYAQLTPNDPNFGQQWAPAKVHLPEAWDLTTGSPEIIVAVIDTGVDYNHPDLKDNIVQGWDFAGDRKNVTTDRGDNPMDVAGHGTHVAGIIAAVSDNNQGIAGVAWNIRIMPLKVQADDALEMMEFDIIAAIDYAIEKKVSLVNCSFGGNAYSDIEFAAFSRLRQIGILAVCAAGNGINNSGPGIDNDTNTGRTYPASYDLDNILSVAASDQSDGIWSSSNYGAASVDLMAPGVSIYSTCLASSSTCNYSPYWSMSGTSMAAPHVTGVAALILSQNPALSYSQVRDAILSTVDMIPGAVGKVRTGGRLNAYAALSPIPGDINGDKRVDLTDAIIALQITAGLQPVFNPQIQPLPADIDHDGKIGLTETLYILQRTAGLRGAY